MNLFIMLSQRLHSRVTVQILQIQPIRLLVNLLYVSNSSENTCFRFFNIHLLDYVSARYYFYITVILYVVCNRLFPNYDHVVHYIYDVNSQLFLSKVFLLLKRRIVNSNQEFE